MSGRFKQAMALLIVSVFAAVSLPAFGEEAAEGAVQVHHIYLHVSPSESGQDVEVQVSVDSDTVKVVSDSDAVKIVEAEVAAVEDEAVVEQAAEAESEVVAPVAIESSIEEQPEAAQEIDEEEGVAVASACAVKDDEGQSGSMGLLFFVFVLAIFLGFELIAKVPSQLHTPLMSGSNAISGITIVGAIIATGLNIGDKSPLVVLLGGLAVLFAMINVVGGYLVTDRMLGMFKHKEGGQK